MARAAATGGGRTYRGQMPIKWYGTLVLIVVLGVVSVIYSRYEREHPSAGTPPAVGSHWYGALAVDVCGQLQPNLTANPQTAAPGLHTDGDGVIRIEPKQASDAGSNATLGRFASEYPGLKITSSTLKLPNEKAHQNGQKCPADTPDAGKAAFVRVKVWSSAQAPGVDHPTIATNPSTLPLTDGQLITVAFVPSGGAIPKPSQTVLGALTQAIAAAGQSTTTTLPVSVSTVPSTASTTTPSSSTSTVPAASTTTAATQPGK